MSFTRNDLLKIYVPFVDVTGAGNEEASGRFGRNRLRQIGDSPFCSTWGGRLCHRRASSGLTKIRIIRLSP